MPEYPLNHSWEAKAASKRMPCMTGNNYFTLKIFTPTQQLSYTVSHCYMYVYLCYNCYFVPLSVIIYIYEMKIAAEKQISLVILYTNRDGVINHVLVCNVHISTECNSIIGNEARPRPAAVPLVAESNEVDTITTSEVYGSPVKLQHNTRMMKSRWIYNLNRQARLIATGYCQVSEDYSYKSLESSLKAYLYIATNTSKGILYISLYVDNFVVVSVSDEDTECFKTMLTQQDLSQHSTVIVAQYYQDIIMYLRRGLWTLKPFSVYSRVCSW